MIDYHKYVGYCRSDEKREKPVGGAGGRWDEEKPVENKPVENKPVESGGDYSTNSSIIRHLHDDRPSDHNTRLGQRIRGISRPSVEST